MLVNITEIEKEEILTVNSRDIAEHFEKEHKHVIRDIDLYISKDVSKIGPMFYESTSPDSYGRRQKCYLMNRDGFTLLVMGFTGQKALEWKLKYIQAFNEMEKELKRLYEERKKWEIERAKGVLIRHVLTDTIKMKVAESPNKRFAYPNYTKLIYKTIFGKSFDELKKEFGVKPRESMREYLTADQLKEVEQMEMLVSSLIGLGMGYSEIKEFISQKYVPSLQLAG